MDRDLEIMRNIFNIQNREAIDSEIMNPSGQITHKLFMRFLEKQKEEEEIFRKIKIFIDNSNINGSNDIILDCIVYDSFYNYGVSYTFTYEGGDWTDITEDSRFEYIRLDFSNYHN